MRATLHLNVECPACGCVMQWRKDAVVFCPNANCENYRLLFERPSVELRPLSVDELSELWTAAAATAGEEKRPL
jgi:uncharacterized Zn finger protein (UPF0148 family)